MTHEYKSDVAEHASLTCLPTVMSRKRIMKNIFVMCVGAFTLFTAYDGPTMLQSTMNKEGGIGVAALAINYAFFCTSALLFPKYFIKRFGSKTTFVLSMILYIPYIASNYYPHWAVMIPVSMIIGFSAALLWSSQATYLNDASVMLAKLSTFSEENNTCHFKKPRNTNDSKKLETNDKTYDLNQTLPSKSVVRTKNELQAETSSENSNTGHTNGKNSEVENSSHCNATISDKNTIHTDLDEASDKTSSHANIKDANGKNHSDTNPIQKNIFYNSLEESDKNRMEPKANDKNIHINLEASCMTAPSSEIIASQEKTLHTKFGSTEEGIKQQIATNKNTLHALNQQQSINETLQSNDSIRNLKISECCSLSNKVAEKYHTTSAVPIELANDKKCGVPVLSDNSVWNISENLRTEMIQNRTSHAKLTDAKHTNNILRPMPKKFQKCSQEHFRNKVESITARVFGIHGMAFLLSHLSGNLLAYFILKRGVDAPNVFINSTCAYACGANYCNDNSNCLTNDLEEVSSKTRIILTTVCVSLSVVSILIVALFLEPLESESEKAPFSLQFLMATYRITKRTDLILLIPYTLYLGQIQGFFAGEFNKAYVSCAWGTYHVSLVSIVYGFFCAVFATSSGWIVKFFGRLTLFTFAALLNIAFSALLLLWKPLHPEMLFTTAGMIGAFVGMGWSQLRAFYGVLFKAEEEAAFGAFYVWYSIGFCLSFAYSTYFCTSVKIYVLIFVSSFGYIGYFTVEKRFSKFKSNGSSVMNLN